MRIRLGPFCTCVWAVLNFAWAVFDTIVGRFLAVLVNAPSVRWAIRRRANRPP